MARHQLRPYVTDRPDRVHVSGELVLLPAYLATPFGLVLHELATNGVKYGALSTSAGSVELSWRLDSQKSGPRLLTLIWHERDGPPVKPPQTTSFGCRLIRGGLPEAVVDHAFEPGGVVCTIVLPLPKTRSGEPRVPNDGGA